MDTTRIDTRAALLLAAVLGLTLATSASAASFGFSFGFGHWGHCHGGHVHAWGCSPVYYCPPVYVEPVVYRPVYTEPVVYRTVYTEPVVVRSVYTEPVEVRTERVVYAQPTYVRREWVPERYETRSEQVLVCAARYDRQYVAPVYETRYADWGTYRVCVRSGYWTEVNVPARYETRYTQVRVPGYYRDVTYRY